LGRVDQSEQLFADAIIAPIIEEVTFSSHINQLIPQFITPDPKFGLSEEITF
jgi:hypothetical protein